MTEHIDTLTTTEMYALPTIDERALYRLSRDEAKLLPQVHRFSQRLGAAQ